MNGDSGDRHLVWLRLHFGTELDPDTVRDFATNLLTDRRVGPVVFEAESDKTAVVWRIGCRDPRPAHRLLATHLPSVTVTRIEPKRPSTMAAWRLSAGSSRLPLRTNDPEATTAALLGALAVSGKAVTLHQLIVGRRISPAMMPARPTAIAGSTITSRMLNAVTTGAQLVERPTVQAMTAKRSLPGAVVSARFGLIDPEDSYRLLPAGYLAAWRTVATPGLRFSLRRERPQRLLTGSAGWRGTLRLNVEELVTMLGWPMGQRSYPRLDRDRSITLPAANTTSSGKPLGTSTHPGHSKRELGLSTTDALRHAVLVGPTGVGKSTLLATMALADIAANRTVVVIDPKADLVDDILARIPQDHLDRTVVLDPSRTDSIVGFNPLAVRANDIHMAVDGLMHIFKNLNAASWGPRSEDLLHASLLTLTATPGPTSLIDIPALLSHTATRQQILAAAVLPEPLLAFWAWFEALSPNERAHICAPLLNKLRPFTLRPNLAALLSSADPFQLHQIFTQRLVLLVPLRKGSIGSEVARLFGSMLVAELWRTITTRASISRQRRHPAFVYADEFQDYLALPTDFGDVLAQSRGLGVGWTLAHQNFDQLPTQLRRIVAANAQTKIFFRLGPDDAAHAAKHLDQLRPSDLARLPAFEAYAQILHKGQLQPVASLTTSPLGEQLRDPKRTATELARRWGQPQRPQPATEPTQAPPDHATSATSTTAPVQGPIGRRKRQDRS